MDLWNLLLEYNPLLLIFSAVGFILSLLWFVVSERRRRSKFETKTKLTDEASFFGQFDDLENPALKIPDFASPQRAAVIPHSVRKDEAAKKPFGDLFSKVEDSQDSKDSPEAEEPQKSPESQILKTFKAVQNPKIQTPTPVEEESREALSEEEPSRDQKLREEALKFMPSDLNSQSDEQRQTEGLQEEDAQSSSAPNDVLQSKTEGGAAVSSVQAGPSGESTEYDQEELKVKELLEQIKKDMREQGEHTS